MITLHFSRASERAGEREGRVTSHTGRKDLWRDGIARRVTSHTREKQYARLRRVGTGDENAGGRVGV